MFLALEQIRSCPFTPQLSPILGNLKLSAQSKDTIILAGGCFWCVEADFEKVNGVSEVISGYTGGFIENPTYKQVVKGGTGHYEAVIIHFDPKIITTKNILDKFFRSIDPTDDGGQFCDRGHSYKSAIFARPNQVLTAKNALLEAVHQGRLAGTPRPPQQGIVGGQICE